MPAGELMTMTSRQDRLHQRQAVDLLQQQCQRMLQAFSTDSDTDQKLLDRTALAPPHEQTHSTDSDMNQQLLTSATLTPRREQTYSTHTDTDQQLLANAALTPRHEQAFSTDSDTHQELLTSATLTPRHEQAIRARLEHKLLIQAAQSALQTYARSLREKVMIVRSRAPKRRRRT